MIPTSEEYKAMMLDSELHSRIAITISDGNNTVTLTNEDIVKGSFSINWRASNNKELGFGSCYAASMSFSAFKQVDIAIEGGYLTIVPTMFFTIDGGYQEIPLGVFYCSEPKTFIKTTSYECLDGMTFFDLPIPSRMSGTPYNVIAFACNTCGVTLGSTSQEVASLPNSAQNITVDPDEVSTFRDLLGLIARLLGAYCIMGRDGKLYIRQFHLTSDMVLDRTRRNKTAFAGYQTVFAGVQCRFKAEQNFYPYSHIVRDYGIVMDLGDIPIIEDTESVKHNILSAIWGYLQHVEYYPCDIDVVGDPSIEAGDMLTTKNREGYDRNIILTSVTYNWRKLSNILSEGANPQVKKVSTAEKRTQQKIENQGQESQVVTTTYVNANTISITDAEKIEISSLRFVTNKDLTAIFGAEIPVYSSGDGYVQIAYVNNGMEGDVVRARVHEGYNLITLVNHLWYDANSIVLLQLKAQTESLTVGGTSPTVTIDQDTIRSYIFAQGLEVEAPWDGIIQISEEVGYVETQMALYGLTESVAVSAQLPAESILSEMVTAMNTKMQMRSLSDTMTLTLEYGDQILRMGQGHRAGMGRMYVRW